MSKSILEDYKNIITEGANLYYLEKTVDYEGSEFIGVFSNLKKANEYKEIYMDKYDSTMYSLEIYEIQIDNPNKIIPIRK